MKRFEYLIKGYACALWDDITQMINEEGEKGWKVINVHWQAHDLVKVMFERELKEKLNEN